MNKHSEEIDKLQECVIQLTQIVESNRDWQRKTEERLDCNDKRLKDIETAPAKKWETVSSYVMTAVLGIVLGLIANQIGL